MKPLVYILILFLIVSCNPISSLCYTGVYSISKPIDKFNDSINNKLSEAHQNIPVLTSKYPLLTNGEISTINKNLKLPNSLTHQTEIRIYKNKGTTNYNSLFRMYKNDKNNWKFEFYEHFNAVIGQAELKTKRKQLSSKNDPKFVFQNLLRSYILVLPSLEEIRWKLIKRGKIKRTERKIRGKNSMTYETESLQEAILDGHCYTVQISSKEWNKQHAFQYDNPERYLKIYPEIDELKYMNEILQIIKSEFNIWND